MPEINDIVYVNNPSLGFHMKPMKVVDKNIPSYIEYMGEDHVVVKDKDNVRHVVSRKNYITEEEYNNKLSDDNDVWIIPKVKTEYINKFAYKLEEIKDGTAIFINDNGDKDSLIDGKYEILIKDNFIHYLNKLQDEINSLRRVIVDLGDIISNDINIIMSKIR